MKDKVEESLQTCGINEFANYLITMVNNVSQQNKDPLSSHWKRGEGSAQSCSRPSSRCVPAPVGPAWEAFGSTDAPSTAGGQRRIKKRW